MKKNHVPFGMLFTQIMWDVSIDVSRMAPRATQLKGVAFMKIGIVDKFPKYAQNHIKRKEKKEAKEKLQFVVS